jgi:hypothetical protein
MKNLLVIFLVFMSASALGHTECTRTPVKVWSALADKTTVWINFDKGSSIYINESKLTEGQVNRFFSMALTAVTTNRSLTVRYPEDDLQCPPTGEARNDMLGIWLLNQ